MHHGLLAQSAEQETLNLKVRGSIPRQPIAVQVTPRPPDEDSGLRIRHLIRSCIKQVIGAMTLRGPMDKASGFDPLDADSISAGGTKVCGKCDLEKPLKEFAKKGNGRQSHCKACQKKVSDAHYRQHKDRVKARSKARTERILLEIQKWIWDYLLEHPCPCGEADPVVLDFDHRDPAEKTASVSDLMRSGYGLPRIIEEIEKCDVLCSNCHRKRTASVGGFWRAMMNGNAN